jgi:hypothetical protein
MMDEGEGEGESSRVWDASRFGDHGFNGGGWRDAQSSGLAFEDGLRRVRQRLETLQSLSRSVWSQKDAVAGREQMLALLGTRLDELKGDRMHLQDRLERLPAKQEDEISELQQEFQLWQQRINDGHKVGLDHFSQTLAQEVEQASEELNSSKSAYRLQSAAFEVKMLPVQRAGDEVFLVTFPLPEDSSVQPGQLSTLNLAFEPRPPSPARTELEVPNVLGYTELVARRLLAKAGFQVELIDQTTDEPGKADRVIDQVPKGGTRTGPEQSLHQPVLVFMGRLGGPAA